MHVDAVALASVIFDLAGGRAVIVGGTGEHAITVPLPLTTERRRDGARFDSKEVADKFSAAVVEAVVRFLSKPTATTADEKRVEVAEATGDAKPEQIGAWHKALIDKGLAPRTVRHAHRLLSQMLKRAVDDRKLATNVATLRKPPRVERAKIEVLQPDQIPALLEGLDDHWLAPIVSLALATGMRRGELLALQWSDVDLDGGVIAVERSVEETRAAGLKIKATKTEAGTRKVTIPANTVSMLRGHRAEQLRLRLALGQGGQPVLVFATIEGEMLSPDDVSRAWRRILTARGLPRVTFHALRHTHASILLASGLPVLTVSKCLGHSKASMTLDVYGHLMPRADDAAAAVIGEAMKWST